MKTRIQQIKQRLEAATPGPWEFNTSLYTSSRIWLLPIDAGLILKSEENELAGKMEPITRLIANAPQDISDLLAVVEVLEACVKLSRSVAGHPSAVEGCRIIIKNHNEALTKAHEIFSSSES